MNEQEAIEFLSRLESGEIKIVEKTSDGEFVLHVENKQKVLQLFSALSISKHVDEMIYRDKIPLLEAIDHFRMVPGAIIRRGAHIEHDTIIMPSFVNIGTHIGSKTMIDSGVTVGSCVYVGKGCHISSNVVLAGVLEPIGAMPVIVDDEVFIGAQCVIAEGMRIGKGAIIASGVNLTSSTKIIDRASGVLHDCVPPYSVVVPGCYESGEYKHGRAYINCAWIVKTVDSVTRSKTGVNELLRS